MAQADFSNERSDDEADASAEQSTPLQISQPAPKDEEQHLASTFVHVDQAVDTIESIEAPTQPASLNPESKNTLDILKSNMPPENEIQIDIQMV